MGLALVRDFVAEWRRRQNARSSMTGEDLSDELTKRRVKSAE